jgi:hypothetical protein
MEKTKIVTTINQTNTQENPLFTSGKPASETHESESSHFTKRLPDAFIRSEHLPINQISLFILGLACPTQGWFGAGLGREEV